MPRISTGCKMKWGNNLLYLLGITRLTKKPGQWTLANGCWEFYDRDEKFLSYCTHTGMLVITGTIDDRLVFLRAFVHQMELGVFIRGRRNTILEIGHSVLDEYVPTFSIGKDRG